MRARPALLLLGTFILMLPVGLADAPAPLTSVSVSLPPGPVNIPLGAEHQIPLKITFTANNLGCTQDATITLPITVMGSPSELKSVTARPSIADAKFTIPSGIYQDAAAAGSGPYNKTIDATLTIMVGADAPANHQHAFQVTATYNGGMPAGCQAVGDLPKATGMAKHQLVTGASSASPTAAPTMTGMSAAEHAQMTAQGAATPPPPPAPSAKKTPSASFAMTLAFVAALAIALRKRG